MKKKVNLCNFRTFVFSKYGDEREKAACCLPGASGCGNPFFTNFPGTKQVRTGVGVQANLAGAGRAWGRLSTTDRGSPGTGPEAFAHGADEAWPCLRAGAVLC